MIQNTILLAMRLFFDGRVALYKKLIPLLAVVYVLSPIDFIPEALPVLGIVDDFGLFMLGLDTFIRVAPPGRVRWHMERLGIKRQDNVEDTPSPQRVYEGQVMNEPVYEQRPR